MGLLVNGENAQGIDARIINRPMVYQIAIVLNLSRSMVFRFAFAEPIVTSTTAITIIKLCSMPKKRKSRWCTASLKCCKKWLANGLMV